MSERLKRLLHDLERFQEINKSDIPELIREIKELEAREKAARYQLERKILEEKDFNL